MFRLAGCCYEDLADSVKRNGLEATLAAIQRQGVYLTHDEFKGKQPIIRSGKHIPATDASFLNVLVSGLMESSSSGSRSRGTRTRHSTESRIHWEAYAMLFRDEFGLAGRAHVETKSILPDLSGLSSIIGASRLGSGVERWFTVGGAIRHSGHYRVMTNAMVLLVNLLGGKAPFPTHLPPNDFSPVANLLARRRAEGVTCVVRGMISSAVRVAAAASQRKLDIRGTLFVVGGEALTDAKRAVIEAAGAEVFPSYWIAEVGPIGYACRQMRSGNCVHLFRDSVAVISHRRVAPLSDVEVDSLLFTTLLPSPTRVLINAEMDDSGVIEKTTCDCVFARAGFTEQIRDVFSFGKLTGQGMTLVGSDLARILEEALPARFGGGPGDYQLVEREGELQTELALRVSPRVQIDSPEKVKDCFLSEVRGFIGGTVASRVWRHTEAVEVVIAEPVATRNGKIHPLHLLGTGRRPVHAP
jgi:hypothetical protein